MSNVGSSRKKFQFRSKSGGTGIGHRHDIVVAGMDVQTVAGQSTGANVKDDRQSFTRNRVQHLMHQYQALARRIVAHSAAGDGKSLTGRRRTVLRLRLQKHQLVAPQVAGAIGDGGSVASPHRR